MKIGLFTDTYFPQVSGVATSIKTLKEELEKQGHDVYIFTTTDRDVKRYEDPTIIRLPSVPFISFKDRRVVYRGFLSSYKIARQYQLDIIHTQTEFGLGFLGKMIARALRVPVIHTYHTQYEDYVHYFAKGKIITPGMIKYIIKAYLLDVDGVICPSRIVQNVLDCYEIKIPKRIIPTGIVLKDYVREDITRETIAQLRQQLGISPDETMLLSLSRISYEKNIQAIITQLPNVLKENKAVKLVVVGDGPYLGTLKQLAEKLEVTSHIIFTGMVPHDDTARYYKACDFFISASTSETQGLTYTESLASGKPIIAQSNPYLEDLITDKMFGTLYQHENDLADAILNAILERVDIPAEKLTKKLYTISSEHFGKSVYAFYMDTIISKQSTGREKLSLTVEGSRTDRSIKLAKTTIKLPVSLAKKTATTSVKVIKAPKVIIQSIRDFMN